MIYDQAANYQAQDGTNLPIGQILGMTGRYELVNRSDAISHLSPGSSYLLNHPSGHEAVEMSLDSSWDRS